MSRIRQVSSFHNREGEVREFRFRKVEPFEHNKAKQPDTGSVRPPRRKKLPGFREPWEVCESGYTEVRILSGVWHLNEGKRTRPANRVCKDPSVCRRSGDSTNCSLISPSLPCLFGVVGEASPPSPFAALFSSIEVSFAMVRPAA